MPTTPQFATYPSLAQRLILGTGGASGIGESIVLALAQQNSKVGFLDINAEAGRKLRASVAALGLPAPAFYCCDLTDIDALQRTFAEISSRHGPVDVLVNNAGDDTRHRVEDVTSSSWDRIMAVNLKQHFFLCQCVLPAMRQQKRGSILNMSSIGWMIPSTGVPVYVTAKAAIVGMPHTLAHEAGADEVRVNCVLPGAILPERQARLWFTDQYRDEILGAQAIKRMILPEEVARLVLFLAADDSSGITNQSYIVDGGWV